jgi:hypothetical protein
MERSVAAADGVEVVTLLLSWSGGAWMGVEVTGFYAVKGSEGGAIVNIDSRIKNVVGGTIVIVAYKPFAGKEEALLALTRKQLPILRSLGLATDRPATACRAADGTIIEVFEWAAGAIERAHAHPEVQELWDRYAEVCTYLPLNQLPEAADIFAGFQSVDL